jgi:hypothetical protein
MDTKALPDDLWPYVRTLLPDDLDTSARARGALVRRRGIPNAEALVRVLLVYGLTDLSLKSVSAWAKALGVAGVSTPALFYRVRDSEGWLSELVAAALAEEVSPPRKSDLRLRAVDATVVTGPGAQGAEWRLHVLSDPASGRFCAVEITDQYGGEGYSMHPVQSGDVVLGDRGYAYSRSIHAAVEAGADVVVRFNPQTLRMCTSDRRPFRLLSQTDEVPAVGPRSWALVMPVFPPKRQSRSKKTWPLSSAVAWLRVRVVCARTRSDKLIWILTTLSADQASDAEVLDLYRLRWQIELMFKRWKSLLDLDALPSSMGPTARSWILSRLLGAALAQKLLDPNDSLSPWGYALR